MDVAVLDPATGAFLAARPRMLDLATRILGSAVEAEDVVQESWMRWQLTDRNNVLNPTAFLATTTTRIAINAVWSAPRRHETYTDPQQLEPHESSARPNVDAERGAAVEEAVLVLLQELAPLERAAYLLREAFGYRIDRSPTCCISSRRTRANSCSARTATCRRVGTAR